MKYKVHLDEANPLPAEIREKMVEIQILRIQKEQHLIRSSGLFPENISGHMADAVLAK